MIRFFLLFVCVFGILQSLAADIEVIVRPSDREATVGRRVEFVCEAPFTDGDELSWSKTSKGNTVYPISTGSPKGFEVYTTNTTNKIMSTMRISGVTVQDTGSYTCTHENSGITNGRFMATLTVVHDGLVVIEGDHVIIEEADMNFTCLVDGSSNYAVTWSRNNVPITSSSLPNSRTEKNNLILVGATYKANAGRYTCTADFNGTSVSASITVGSDIRIKAPDSVKFTEGERGRFECTAEYQMADPKPVFQWRVQNDTLTLEDYMKGSRFSVEAPRRGVGSVLHMTNVVKEDKGDYTCIVTSNVTQVQHTMVLRVRDRLAALWPFIGIMSEVFLLIIIIFIHEKCTEGDDFGEEDEDDDEGNEITKEKEKINLDGEGDIRMKASKE